MDSLNLKHNSFQNKNNRKVTQRHVSRSLIFSSKISAKGNNILSKVKQYLDRFLDPGNTSYTGNTGNTVNEALKFLILSRLIILIPFCYVQHQIIKSI